MKNYGIIIEARTGSKRFPNKIIKKIKNRTLLEYLIDRVKFQNKVKKIVVATSTRKRDHKIIKIAKKKQVNFYRGSENDLIDRELSCYELVFLMVSFRHSFAALIPFSLRIL